MGRRHFRDWLMSALFLRWRGLPATESFVVIGGQSICTRFVTKCDGRCRHDLNRLSFEVFFVFVCGLSVVRLSCTVLLCLYSSCFPKLFGGELQAVIDQLVCNPCYQVRSRGYILFELVSRIISNHTKAIFECFRCWLVCALSNGCVGIT